MLDGSGLRKGFKMAEERGYKIKKEYRCTPTFVNLKSNTMKNTVQIYGLF